METVNANSASASASSSQAHVVHIHSPQIPSQDLIQDKRKYLDQCVPLNKLALRGDWKAAKSMINADKALLNAAITKDLSTLLHVVAATKHVHFVEQLVESLSSEDLELKTYNGNTALCYAAISGNQQIATMMIEKNRHLPQIRGAGGVTPLYVAALYGRSDMVKYLYSQTVDILEEEEWNALFFLSIKNDLYDLCLQMLQKQPMLALVRDENNHTGLHVLARKRFSRRGQWYHQNQIMNSSIKSTLFLQVVRCLCNTVLNLDCIETRKTILNHPSQIIFDATEAGNFEFVVELMRSDPDLIWKVDSKNRTIIHIAVLRRHASIFSLIHELGSFTELIVPLKDEEENNILHYAAKLAPPNQLNLISGAALQMTHELLWFKEVKKLMPPSEIHKKNSSGKTPDELFVDEHKELLSKAESWTKRTANNCMLISALISTGVLTAAFNIPGGRNKSDGAPTFLQKATFLIFALSNATALISSAVSILIFLSVLISSYAVDHHFKSLPFKLLFGLIAQIISITSMMMAFSVAFFITYYHGLMWVPKFISVLAFLPIPLFLFLLLPLWSDIMHSSYFCMHLFRPRKHLLN